MEIGSRSDVTRKSDEGPKSSASEKPMTPLEPQPELAKALGLSCQLYFKREDLYPIYMSHKGRSIPPMIDLYVVDGFSQFAISSSGNGALAAALHIKRLNEKNGQSLRLTIFVGNTIASEKLKKLRGLESESGGAITIEQVEKPLRALLEKTKNTQIKSLRQSTDGLATDGYKTLSQELLATPDLRAVFIPSSSGTTAQGLGQAFIGYNKAVQIHIVQTEQVHRLVSDAINSKNTSAVRSIADAIVDTVGYRKNAVGEIVEKSGGAGWIVNNSEIEAAVRLVKEKTGLAISTNSALSVAGLQKALADKKFSAKEMVAGAIVCLITGN